MLAEDDAASSAGSVRCATSWACSAVTSPPGTEPSALADPEPAISMIAPAINPASTPIPIRRTRIAPSLLPPTEPRRSIHHPESRWWPAPIN